MIYKFETDHCPMCKQADRLMKKHNVKYESIDAEQFDSLVVFYGIRSVPCLIETESLGEPARHICRSPQAESSLINFLNELV